jgi:DNA-binding IclR family transcriptional regulator
VIRDQVLRLLRDCPGRWGIVAIANCLRVSRAEVNRALLELHAAGLVARGENRDGQACWWALELAADPPRPAAGGER